MPFVVSVCPVLFTTVGYYMLTYQVFVDRLVVQTFADFCYIKLPERKLKTESASNPLITRRSWSCKFAYTVVSIEHHCEHMNIWVKLKKKKKNSDRQYKCIHQHALPSVLFWMLNIQIRAWIWIRSKTLDQDIHTHWYQYVSSTEKSGKAGISCLPIFGRDNKPF